MIEDNSGLFFEYRRKVIDNLIVELKTLSELPPLRRTIMTNIEINHKLLLLAHMAKYDNEMLKRLDHSNSIRREITTKLTSIVGFLVDELQTRKESEPLLKGIDIKKLKLDLEELKKFKPTLEFMESLESELREVIEKRRRFLKNNK